MIKGVVFNDETGRVRIVCDRDRLRRTVLDVPIGGHPCEVEIKLTATSGAGHVEPINRFIAVEGDEAFKQGILVCRTETERILPGSHTAMSWQSFSEWPRQRLTSAAA
ncbi:MAG: hypothetical protein IT509_11625 [Rhodocyclaceae bacterium]|nr:hypothetical protein [Rhodocyclaceae bacterium]